MNDIIHLLPDSVANQIAAGEVVQRPSSIIKEMVENSIDACAEHVQVIVVDGGKTSVQIIDDGKGMSETDARMAFERHATSKISKASDLYNLSTMGFRGEALASIAAVAQVELKTRRVEDELGTMITISGSKVEREEPVACPVGSNFSVNNIFFNVPARRKFLKSNQTELSNVVADFQRIVLVHPDVSFSLFNNGVEMYDLPKSSVKQRIIDVFGKKLNADLLPIEVETSLVHISGYVGKPESSKKKNAHQYFFVNGRYMRHPYFHSAVMKAYESIIPVGEQVPYFIYFSVDASSIDVNVHPTKTEIKFDNEQPIWQVLSAAVRETLGQFCNVPMIDFDIDGKPDIPVMGAGASIPRQPKLSAPTYNPFASKHDDGEGFAMPRCSASSGWEKLYEGTVDMLKPDKPKPVEADIMGVASSLSTEEKSSFEFEKASLMFDDVPEEKQLQSSLWSSALDAELNKMPFDISVPKMQYRGRYIVLPSAGGVMFVNQHRAHVCVLYEQYMRGITDHKRPSQKELFPVVVQFDKRESIMLEDMMDDVTSLGFDLSCLGGGSYSVNGIPVEVAGLDVGTLLHDMVASAMSEVNSVRTDAQKAMALTMAKKSAIVYGQALSLKEMDQLLTDLFDTSSPALTPDGQVVYAVMEDKVIDNML